jgi:predicted Zn-dependent peptidase
MFETSKIDDIVFLYSPTDGIHSASLGVFIGAGARFESKNTKGIAHFLEHMLFKGSHRYSYKKIKQEIEGRGGMVNAFTSQETTAYYARILDKNTIKTVDIFLDMIKNPLLLTNEINKERKVIFEEIKMHRDLPHIHVTSLLEKLLWKNHPLGEDVAGKFTTISKITKKDLRGFHKKFYTPRNIIFSYVGSKPKDKIIHKISAAFKNCRNIKGEIKTKKPRLPGRPRFCVEQKKVSQTHVCVGFPVNKVVGLDYLKIKLMHVVLGANMSSRLFEQIRERRGLCYDITTEIYRFQDTGAFAVQSALTQSRMQVLLKHIFKELYKIKQKDISSPELRRAKDYLLGQMIIANEQPSGRMLYMAGAYRFYKKIYDPDYLYNYIDSITAAQIKTLARKIFDFNKVCIAAISSQKQLAQESIKKVIENNSNTYHV